MTPTVNIKGNFCIRSRESYREYELSKQKIIMEAREIPFLLDAAISLFAMYMVGWSNHEYNMRVEAIKANVAYWSVDEKGFPKFHWITE